MVCDCRPLKDEKFRVRITVVVDLLPYHLDEGSPEPDLLETKLILNSVISNSSKGTILMSLDIKDHFVAAPKDPKHVRVKHNHVPDNIREKHNIDQLVANDEWVCIKI